MARRQRARWLVRGSAEYLEMIYGSEPWDKAMFRRVRAHWEAGGRELVMSGWNSPGLRPLGFWLADVPYADQRRAEKACTCWADAILFLGLADDDEARAIAETNEIGKQVAWIRRDKRLYPEDYGRGA